MKQYLTQLIDQELSEIGDGGYDEYSAAKERLENFVKLVEQATLERAAVEFSQPHMEYFGHEIQETIRALKTQGE